MQINWKKVLVVAGLVFPVVALFLLVAHPASAAIVNCGNEDGGSVGTGCKLTDLFSSAANLINYMLSGAAVIAVGGVVYGGYLMVFSAGNQTKQGEGRKAVTNSMIGLAIILVAFLLVKTMFSVLGFRGGNPVEDLNQLAPGQGFQLINGDPNITPTPTGGQPGGGVPSGTAQQLATQLLQSPGANCFLNYHVNNRSVVDGATALDNLRATARGELAKNSAYGNAPGGTVALDARMLQTLVDIYSDPVGRTSMCPVTAIAGSSHAVSPTDPHYLGKAFDLDHAENASVVRSICERNGGNFLNESNHLHCSWR